MEKYSLFRLIKYFLILGTIGFGGSVALANMMQEDVVEKNHWLTKEEFTRGLTLSQLAPGPLAAQLAMYIGYTKNKTPGATLAGIAFVLPSFILVLLLSILYSRFGNLSFLQAALYGIGAGVIGIIASSGYSLTKMYMKKKYLLWIIYLGTFLFTLITKSTNIFVFIVAGLLTLIIYKKDTLKLPKKLGSFTALGITGMLSLPMAKIFVFFFLAGLLAFGGGLAIVPYLQYGVVQQYHWLTNRQFLDAVAVAMITPGPVVIASTFIGYFAGGIAGAIFATIAIFLPVYIIVIFLTPLFHKHAKNPHLISFTEGVLASAMASIAASIILLGSEAIKDITTLLIAIFALVTMRIFKLPSVIIVLIAGVVGLIFYH